MLGLLLLASCAEPAPEDRMWRYVNDEGRTVYVNDPARIPEAHRDAAVAMESSETPTTLDSQTIYRYRGRRGRDVFVNGIDRVPESARPSATAVDLSKVSTNPELGRDLDRALEEEWEALVESDPCRKARAEAAGGLVETMWRENGHLVVLGGAVFLLLLVTPWMMRRFDAPTWARVLAVAIPALAVAGLFAHLVITTSRSTRSLARAAEPCDPTGLSRVSDSPDALAERIGLVDRLRTAIEAADVESGTRVHVRPTR